MKYIDHTMKIFDSMPVFPGDDELHLIKSKDIKKDGYTIYHLSTGMHSGTHIDGPMHMLESGLFISDFPTDRFLGKGFILNAANLSRITVCSDDIIPEECIVLIHTGWSKRYGSPDYFNGFPVVHEDLSELCVSKKVKMVCIDTPSIDNHPHQTHKILLKNNILIAENLVNLDKLLNVSRFNIIALPLNISADSSPARIIAEVMD